MDESDHLTLVNAGDEEVVSQEKGGREGSAAGGEEGGCCCASAIAVAHMRTHRARENSTRLVDLFACEDEEHAYGGDAVTRALSLSHTCGHTGCARTVLDWVVLR